MILYFALILTVSKIINSSQQHYCIEKLRSFRPILKKGNNSFVMKACNQLVGKPVVSEWHRVREVAQLIVSVSEASCHWTTTIQHSPGTGQSSCLHPLSLCLPRHNKQSFNRTSLQIRFLCCWLIKYSVINKSSLDGWGGGWVIHGEIQSRNHEMTSIDTGPQKTVWVIFQNFT